MEAPVLPSTHQASWAVHVGALALPSRIFVPQSMHGHISWVAYALLVPLNYAPSLGHSSCGVVVLGHTCLHVAMQLDCPPTLRSLGTSVHLLARGLALTMSLYAFTCSSRRSHQTKLSHFEGSILLAVPAKLRWHLARSAASPESTLWQRSSTRALDQHAPDLAMPDLHNVTNTPH